MLSQELAAAARADNWEVPGFRVADLKPRATRYAVLVPVLNEGERIRGQLCRMHNLGIPGQADVIVVDGGSTDGSLAEDFLALLACVR